MSLFSPKKGAWLLGGVLSLALCGTTARANVLGDIGRSISSLWGQKARKSQAAQAALSQARSKTEQVEFLHDRLEKTQQILQTANNNYTNYFRQMRQTEAAILDTRERAEEVAERYEAHRILFGRRLASMQRHGDTNFLQIALGSDSLSDLTRRTAFFQALTQRDAELQNQIKADKAEILQTQNELDAQWAQRNRLQKDANRERERIASGEAQQRQMWRQMNSSRLALVNYALAQQKSSQEIDGMIGSLQSRKAQIIASYEADVARERAQMRAQAAYRSRQRRRVVRYEAPRRYRSYRAASSNSFSNNSSSRPSNSYRSNNSYRTARSYTPTRPDRRGRYRYSGARSNLARKNGLQYAPRIDLAPQYAPRVELAPMPIEALQKPISWTPPARGRLSSRFGMRRHPVLGRLKLHTGDDIAASYGSPIRAARSGRVLWAGWKKAYGNTVIVDVGGGMTTLYGHASRLGVRSGQPVRAGEQLGNIGATGFATGPHLHFEVRKNGKPIDPTRYLRGR
jgi:murein DD-endopeptidase MepM/ murein hydrolase activator NlpD